MALTDLNFQYEVIGTANYESDIFVVSVSAVSELNGLSSVLCATSGSNCTWPSVAAAKKQNNIRWKNIIETQTASHFSYRMFPTHKAFQWTYGKEVPTGKNFL